MSAKFLLLGALCAVVANSVSGTNIIDKEMCGKGQGYWCSNIMNAMRCNAVKHCFNIWEHQSLHKHNGEDCNICIDMVSQAKAQLMTIKTQEELKQVFEGSCKHVPEQIRSENCMQLLDEFISEWVESLASQMNPRVVCSVAGLCDSFTNNELLAEYTRSIAPLEPAEQTVSNKDELIQLPSRADVHMNVGWKEEIFGREYTHLPRVDEEDENPNMIGNEIPEVTYMGEVNKPRLDNNPESNYGGFVICKVCKLIVSKIDRMLKKNVTGDKIKHILQQSCKYMIKQLSKKCYSFVTKYTDLIIKYLIDKKDSRSPCTALKFCSKQRYNQVHRVATVIPYETHLEEVNQPLLSHLPNGVLQGSMTCKVCGVVVSEIVTMLKNNVYEEETKLLIKYIYCFITSPYTKECSAFVDQVTDMVKKYVAENMDPTYICTTLKWCNYNKYHLGIRGKERVWPFERTYVANW